MLKIVVVVLGFILPSTIAGGMSGCGYQLKMTHAVYFVLAMDFVFLHFCSFASYCSLSIAGLGCSQT
jgi:hypothetical protein